MPVTLASYTLVRLAGSYDVTDNIALIARVENAFDAHYEEVFGYRTRGARLVRRHPGEVRIDAMTEDAPRPPPLTRSGHSPGADGRAPSRARAAEGAGRLVSRSPLFLSPSRSGLRWCRFRSGPPPIRWARCCAGLFTGDGVVGTIAREIRLPRAALALVVGAALGASGAALAGSVPQPAGRARHHRRFSLVRGIGRGDRTLFRHRGGVSAGVAEFAIAGALGSAVLLYLLARRGAGTLALVLAGVAISSLAAALTALTLSLAQNPYAMTEMVLWLMGSLKDRTLADLAFAAPLVAVGIALLVSSARALDALTLGEDAAASLGIARRARARSPWSQVRRLPPAPPPRRRARSPSSAWSCRICCGRSTAQAPGRLILPSALAGAALVAAADIGVRLLSPFSGGELLLGVFTALSARRSSSG